MKDLKNEIQDLKDQINDDNQGGDSDEYAPQVKILQDALNDFIEKQKVENFRLKEEIALLEKVVGIKSKTYTYYYDQTLSENEFASKFIIKDENI